MKTKNRNEELLVLTDVIEVLVSNKEEEKWIVTMTEKVKKRHNKRRLTNDVDLYTRSQKLNKTYFEGELDYSIQFVTNQHKRYGSCSPHNNTIRISDKVGAMPQWVQDYVIVHELAHLIQPNHSKDFWRLVNAYPYTERARGYLIAKGNTDEIEE